MKRLIGITRTASRLRQERPGPIRCTRYGAEAPIFRREAVDAKLPLAGEKRLIGITRAASRLRSGTARIECGLTSIRAAKLVDVD